MSVITRPHLPHRRSAPSHSHRPVTVPRQRDADELRPWTSRAPSAGAPRGRRTALLLAGLGVAGAAGVGLALTAPWDEDAASIQAPAGSVGVSTTEQLRDDALARRGAGSVGVNSTEAQRDAATSRRGPE